MIKASAVFDIGKTNKKFLLFGEGFELLHQEEISFEETLDDDGFPCDDIGKVEDWLRGQLRKTIAERKYEITRLNFSTYGATLVFLDADGKRCAPVYNYLKPIEAEIKELFAERFNRNNDFFRRIASPDLGLLNSGLQIFRLKHLKPALYNNVKHILHLPNYFSYLFTGKIVSEYTSIGCHTALWNYDEFKYDEWLSEEGIILPPPCGNETSFDINLDGKRIKAGIGIHDSSASLVPYLNSGEEFILISTGTWCINMNPFNSEPLISEELKKDCLCYLSTRKEQVKSSRFFMGHIHDRYLERVNDYFNRQPGAYREVRPDSAKWGVWKDEKSKIFTPELDGPDFSRFESFDEAYNRLVFDITESETESLRLIIPQNDTSKNIYITGGFSNNPIFTSLIASEFPSKNVFISDIKDASALGAAIITADEMPSINFEMKRIME